MTGARAMPYAMDLVSRLKELDFDVINRSSYTNRVIRFIDMISAVIVYRHRYSQVLLPVFSGRSFFWAFWTVRLASVLRARVIVVLRGGNLPDYARAQSRRMRIFLRKCDVVIAPSPYLQEAMREYRDDIVIIHNAISVENYHFAQRAVDPAGIVWLRAFNSLYNPQLVPRVLEMLSKDYPNVSITMAGPDSGDGSLEETKQIATRLGVARRITFSGQIAKEHIPEFLQSYSVYLNTPRIDNTPVTVLEAMACGLRVVSVRVGGIPYLLTDTENALLVPDDDAAAMADAVRRLLQDEELAAHLASNGRRTVESFDWKRILPLWKLLLEGVKS